MRAVWLLVLLAIMGCGKRDTGPFEPYVAAFEAEAARFGKPVTVGAIKIEFSEEVDEHGYCEIHLLHTRITVKGSWWERANEDQRELLMFHELGHCVLLKTHTREPGIMNPYQTGYGHSREGYLQELFD